MSREPRASVRGKGQTSYWKARKVALDTLSVTRVAPRQPDQKRANKLTQGFLEDEEQRRFRWLTKEAFADLDLEQQKKDKREQNHYETSAGQKKKGSKPRGRVITL